MLRNQIGILTSYFRLWFKNQFSSLSSPITAHITYRTDLNIIYISLSKMRPFYLGGIGLSRIFQNKKRSEPQAVRVHFRNPSDYDGPITAKVSHWVLQVGKYFYELAEPAGYVVERAIAEQNIERVKNEDRSEIGNEEANEHDGIDENNENNEDGEDERHIEIARI